MLSVRDHLCAHLRVGKNELFHAGLHGRAEPDAKGGHGAHCTPEVIDVPDTGVECTLHLGPARVRMSARNQASMLSGCPIEGCCTGKLCGTGCYPDDAQVEEMIVFF